MRIQWDEDKRQKILAERKLDFADLEDLLYQPYVEDRSLSYTEQYRVIGFARGRLATFIVEYRQDILGEFIWVVTAWRSTLQEQKVYEQETQ
jgi:uncharacterized DUF497 family protein